MSNYCVKSAFMGDDPVCKIYQGDELIYPTQKDWSKEYFTIEALEDGEFVIYKHYTIRYRINGGEWGILSNWASHEHGTGYSVNLLKDDILELSSDRKNWNAAFTENTFAFNVCGNIESLYHGNDFIGKTDTIQAGQLFRFCSGLTDASNLILPAIILDEINCYNAMFSDCPSLTGVPQLPATTLTQSCYSNMFYGCTSLTTAPALPATTLAQSCYNSMFYGCTSLAAAPALPSTTLATSCYNGMFNGCTSLTTAPVLPATTLTESCYQSMFQGCTSLATAPALPATTLAKSCYRLMFNVCSIEVGPVLPAATLVDSCYEYMFSCPLKSLVCLATDISATNCTNAWLTRFASNGTFYKNPLMNDWTKPIAITTTNAVPYNWDIVDYQE